MEQEFKGFEAKISKSFSSPVFFFKVGEGEENEFAPVLEFDESIFIM